MFARSLLALSVLSLSVSVVHADLRADSHAPAGVMFEHVHKQGEVMVGYRVQQDVQKGDLLYGSQSIDGSNANATRYSMLPTEHTMTMHMLDIMYAPTNNLTLMLMPMYMQMEMEMAENPFYVATGGAHGGHGAGGHGHEVSGMGDTTLAALFRVYKDQQQELIATVALIAPTGQEDLMGDDGKPVHYGMQPGAGIWQAMPSLTYTFKQNDLMVGGQVLTRQPFEGHSDLDVRVPDLNQATAWVSYAWAHELSTSVRVQYSKEDIYEGHYNVGHNHSAPGDRQVNYGGEQTLTGLGLNWVTPTGSLKGLRVGLEYLLPVSESVNGVQLETDNQLTLSISKAL